MKNHFGFLILLLGFIFYGCATYYDMGKIALDIDDYDQAALYYNKELSVKPNDNEAWRDLGIIELKKNNYNEAEKNLKMAFYLDENDGETLFYLGMLYEKLNDYDTAISFYKRYINLGFFDDEIIQKIKGRIDLITRKKMEIEIKSILQNESSKAEDTLKDNTLAVLYFQNMGNDKQLKVLQKGLAEMLITDLSQVKSLKIIERLKLQMLINEMKMDSTSLFDQRSAPRFGKLLAVKNLIKGSFLSINNEKLSIDASIINVPDGSYEQSKEVTGNISDYFKLQKDLVFNILDKLDIVPTPAEKEKIEAIPTESFIAFLKYCRGLELEDQENYYGAADEYRSAAEIDPSFSLAKAKYYKAKDMSDAVDIDAVEKDVTAPDVKIGRLIESNSNLTGEIYNGRDDHNTFTTSGDKTKVIIRVIR